MIDQVVINRGAVLFAMKKGLRRGIVSSRKGGP